MLQILHLLILGLKLLLVLQELVLLFEYHSLALLFELVDVLSLDLGGQTRWTDSARVLLKTAENAAAARARTATTQLVLKLAQLVTNCGVSVSDVDPILLYIRRADEKEALVDLIVDLFPFFQFLHSYYFLHFSLPLLDLDQLLVFLFDPFLFLALLGLDGSNLRLLLLDLFPHSADVLSLLFLLLGRVQHCLLSAVDPL